MGSYCARLCLSTAEREIKGNIARKEVDVRISQCQIEPVALWRSVLWQGTPKFELNKNFKVANAVLWRVEWGIRNETPDPAIWNHFLLLKILPDESHHFKTGKYPLTNGNEAINSKDVRLPRYQRAFLFYQEK